MVFTQVGFSGDLVFERVANQVLMSVRMKSVRARLRWHHAELDAGAVSHPRRGEIER